LTAAPEGLSEADFDRVEAAVMETERGRWFLAEFSRRIRAEDSQRILASIDRLEARMAAAQEAEARARLDADRAADLLREISDLLAQIKPDGGLRGLPPPLAKLFSTAPPERKSPPTLEALSELERRLSALARLEALDDDEKLNWLG
jgi:multidrug efflux pump subunit AcrA (membrane-fusion protein)